MVVKNYLQYLTIAAIGLVAIFFLTQPRESMLMEPSTTTIEIGSVSIPVEVVSTPAEREKGLSGRETLLSGTGMFFVFEEERSWDIWMKEMKFPIDIIWANRDGTIITIAENIAPETYPQTFSPTSPTAKYVLEVPAGFVQIHGIAEGMEIVL